MAAEKHWYLFCYDIREPKRWRQVFKKLKGRGNHIQYSIFRLNLSKAQVEELRWEIEKELTDEDDLLIVRLCQSCAQRVIDSREHEHKWHEPQPKFDIF
ncbi:MAG: CRISPR-associated endonuclease Cas2 [Proteobacteria bacterium]|nr:CRISPR-associated endonuclease Cas2 [Pseudomonadota bacterium]MBU4295153.1 CRISPR-associated endonuclease Cas2 [Pseudomonadota bacterium]MCG2749065.1 CRISPR-associated endonuclease Cas2 [Desulfobulbaceae bacterium]